MAWHMTGMCFVLVHHPFLAVLPYPTQQGVGLKFGAPLVKDFRNGGDLSTRSAKRFGPIFLQ